MSLLEDWKKDAYEVERDQASYDKFWNEYFILEQGIYEKILGDYGNPVKGTVAELAKKFDIDLHHMVGFLDGIDESLKKSNPLETMDENTEVSLDYDPEKLYYNMVACKAEWLYKLPQWNDILSEEKRASLYKEQRSSLTYVRAEAKVGRNDPCPCGSGKKYKKCCGK